MSSKSFSPNRLLAALALLTGIVGLATPAFATTLTFGSYGGNTAPAGLSNSAISYNNNGDAAPSSDLKGTGTVSAYNPGYSNTLTGTTWVSYDPNTANGDNGGQTVYKTTYTGNIAAAYGSISVIADDTVDVYLNNMFLGTTAPSTYDTLKTFGIATSDYKDGLNTFKFIVTNVNGTTQNGGPTGFDFKATAATPEPSSLIMLGTGVLSAAGMVRRRFVS